jgi:phosphate acetyltransferase
MRRGISAGTGPGEVVILTNFKERVRTNPRRLVFPEGDDIRVAGAVRRLADEGLIREAVLLGNPEKIRENARALSLDSGIYRTHDIDNLVKDVRYRNEYRKARNLSVLEGEILDDAMRDPVVIGSILLRFGEVDCLIAGLQTYTAHVLSTGINIIKADRQFGVVTSFLLIYTDNPQMGENGLILIADPVVNPDPSIGVLCKIAEAAAYFTGTFLNMQPRIAFLSYSSRGSGFGKSVDKMRIAAERTREKLGDAVVDGELQLDASIIPGIAKQKVPDSPLGGRANILIFPNLDSANIGSKLVQFFGNAKLIGPIIFGLNRPFNDISRGADESDIVNLAIISQLQAV